MHHALKTCGRLENGSLLVSIFRIDEFRDDATTRLQSLHIIRDLKYERVGVAWERRISFSISNITLRVPFGFQ